MIKKKAVRKSGKAVTSGKAGDDASDALLTKTAKNCSPVLKAILLDAAFYV